jgi:ADP-ribosylglycohydrolase
LVTRADRIAGGLVGLLVGDALGVPYEFHPAAEIPPIDQIDLSPPASFRRAHEGVPVGTWSDDGAQALCLLASLLDDGALDFEGFARRLVAWLSQGALAVDGRVFDCGIQTRRALFAIQRGAPARTVGGAAEGDNGNGSLMRVLPLALWHRGSDEQLASDAALQSQVTHAHPRSQACCALYVLWARRILEGRAEAWTEAVAAARKFVDRRELDQVILARFRAPPRGSGYVVDTLHAAVALNEAGSYEDVVKRAIALGGDTDTTACVAGGIAGVRLGLSAIPQRWRTALRGHELYAPLLERLLAQAG